MADKQVLNVSINIRVLGYLISPGTGKFNLTPTSYDHSRSQFTAKESGEVIIIPQLNPYLQAYAEADNYAGRFEITQSPFAVDIDRPFLRLIALAN